jgi:ComF family protein
MDAFPGKPCEVCSRPMKAEHAGTCGECLKEMPPYTGASCFGPYTGTLREAIHLLKFRQVKRLARPLGELLADLALPSADLVVPVPLSLKSLRERGFNQTLLMARPLAKRRGLPLEGRLLFKKKETPPQTLLSRSARLRNLRGSFAVTGALSGERVLLVDDVITTGATVSECTRALLRAGASEVCVAALARA